jgi:hypothetical protein
MFADIRNFSAYCEARPPQEAAAVLHAFFSTATRVVEANGGVIEAFQGDAVLAVWYGEEYAAEHRALKAELQSQITTNGGRLDVLEDAAKSDAARERTVLGIASNTRTLILLLVARVFNQRWAVATASVVALLMFGFVIGGATISAYFMQEEGRQNMARLLPEIDRSPSFLSFALDPFPAFPTALYTQSDYKGFAIWPIFISTARSAEADPGLRDKATRLTFDQAIHELERQPALVIVERPASASGWERPNFDLLSWFKTDAGFRDQWQHYRHDKTIGVYELYRRD